MVEWLTEREQIAWRTFLEANISLLATLERRLQQDSGLSFPDYEIFVRLSEAPGRRMRMSDLAGQALVSRSRLSHAIGRMEKLGWVERSSCPTDGRGTFAHLTDKGFAALEEAAPLHVAAVRKYVFDALTPDQVAQLEKIGSAIRGVVGD